MTEQTPDKYPNGMGGRKVNDLPQPDTWHGAPVPPESLSLPADMPDQWAYELQDLYGLWLGKLYGNMEDAPKIAEPFTKVIPVDDGRMQMVIAENKRLNALNGVRSYGDSVRWQTVSDALAVKYQPKHHGRLYEAILGITFDRRNFAKKMLHLEILNELDETVWPTPKREAKLFSFNAGKYEELKRKGFRMEF